MSTKYLGSNVMVQNEFKFPQLLQKTPKKLLKNLNENDETQFFYNKCQFYTAALNKILLKIKKPNLWHLSLSA